MKPLLMSFICALVWGVWPILTSMSKASASYISMTLSVSTAVFIVTYFLFRSEVYTSISVAYNAPDQKTFWLPILAGILNAIGIVLYSMLLSKDSGLDPSKYVVIVTALLPVVVLVTAYLLIGTQVSWQKIFGIVLVCASIYYVNK